MRRQQEKAALIVDHLQAHPVSIRWFSNGATIVIIDNMHWHRAVAIYLPGSDLFRKLRGYCARAGVGCFA